MSPPSNSQSYEEITSNTLSNKEQQKRQHHRHRETDVQRTETSPHLESANFNSGATTDSINCPSNYSPHQDTFSPIDAIRLSHDLRYLGGVSTGAGGVGATGDAFPFTQGSLHKNDEEKVSGTSFSGSSLREEELSGHFQDKRKGGKPRRDITKEQIGELLHLSQQEAAMKLGVSVSTLKRRYQQYYDQNNRWPLPAQRIVMKRKKEIMNEFYESNQMISSNPLYKMNINYIVHEDDLLSEKCLDTWTTQSLKRTFERSFNASQIQNVMAQMRHSITPSSPYPLSSSSSSHSLPPHPSSATSFPNPSLPSAKR